MNGARIALAFGLFLCSPLTPPALAQGAQSSLTEEEAHAVAVDSYVYFYPLISMDVTRKQLINSEPGTGIGGPMNAFVNMDTAAARRIIAMDKSVDQYNSDIIAELQTLMQTRPEAVPPALHCFSAVRHIERIADHATNIAEDVIYLAEGDIVRHRHEVETTSEEPLK